MQGYICVNDVSARDLQFGDGQWTRGKSPDSFCPVGPRLVAREEIADPQALAIRCVLNGQTMQDSSTSRDIFSVAEIIAYVTRVITLEPGDLIATGTPAGVGVFRDPKILLKDGDEVSVEIEGLGTRLLANAYTDGAVAAVAHRVGIVDGRAVYLENPTFLAEFDGALPGRPRRLRDAGRTWRIELPRSRARDPPARGDERAERDGSRRVPAVRHRCHGPARGSAAPAHPVVRRWSAPAVRSDRRDRLGWLDSRR